jgi:hypothetical protein
MGEVSLGGGDSLDNQRDIPRSSDWTQSVPDDVLAEIFQAGTSMCRDPVGIHTIYDPQLPVLPFPHLVSSVSRRWRGVALSSPRLWTTIVFNCNRTTNHEGPSLWIKRSGVCLLDITISMDPWLWGSGLEFNLQSAMDQIMPHTGRWRRFTVDNLPRNMVETVVLRLRTASAPHLRDFKMALSRDDGFETDAASTVCDRLFTGGAASLTEARLIGVYIYTPPLTGLTYLQLGGTYQATKKITANCLRDLLTASPFLINLVLHHLDIAFPLNTTSSVSNIQIPSLCSLTIANVSSHALDFWKLFSLFSLPKLETLMLASMSQFSEPLTDIGHQSHATVTILQLVKCGRIHHSLAKSLYSSFPCIIQLDLVASSGLVLEHPHVRSDGDLAIIWPHLNTITITYPVEYETICDFIDNRKEMGHPLGTVNVWSRIRQQMEVFKLDYVSKSKFQYPAGLKSAIEEVKHEEYEDSYEEEHLTSRDFDGYEYDSD